ncbi:MAG TPA: VOC family protein [Candidatus Nanopelagicales bacterium]|jgi:methylmalonyl-CoA epimerase
MTDLLTDLDASYDHVAVAGPSLPDLLGFYRDALGGRFSHGEILEIGAVVVTLILGDGKIELMAPTPGSTFFDKFFAATQGRGGVHHLTFTVPDLRRAVADLDARGVRTFGLAYGEQWSEVFLHPRDNGGVLIQLAEIGPDVMSIVNRDLAALIAAASG